MHLFRVHPLFLMLLLQVGCSRIYGVLVFSIGLSETKAIFRVTSYVIVVRTVETASLS